MPLIRSLGLAYPDDARAWATVDAYLFGPSLLVAPVFERGATSRAVTLPVGAWWDYWTNKRLDGGRSVTLEAALDVMPLLVRAGSIVSTGPVKQYSDELLSGPVQLTVYPGANGSFTFYDDDGQSFAYERGDFAEIAMHWDDAATTLTLHHAKGSRSQSRRFRVKLVDGPEKTVTVGAGSAAVRLS